MLRGGAAPVWVGGVSACFAFGAVACEDGLPDLGRRPVNLDASVPMAPGVVFVQADAATTSDASLSDDEPFTHGGVAPESPDVADLEPRRDRALTLVNGVVDASFVYFCSEALAAGVREFASAPFPASGLEYGETLVLGPDAIEWDMELNWWLVATERALPDGVTCEQLYAGADPWAAPRDAFEPDAAPRETFPDAGLGDASAAATLPLATDAGLAQPEVENFDASPTVVGDAATEAGVRVELDDLRFVPFVTIPPGVITEELSYLLVASGCVGGYPAVPDELCGAGYASRQSSLAPVFASLSRRTEFSSLGLQFCNASVLDRATLRSDPSTVEDGVFFTIAADVGAGSLAPRTARTGVALDQVGTPLADVLLNVERGLRSDPGYQTTWGAILEHASPTELANGRAVTLVLLGPAADLASLGVVDESQFNSPKLVLLPNDPGREVAAATPGVDAGP